MGKMTLGSKLLVGGILMVLTPLVIVGFFSFAQSSRAIQESAGREMAVTAAGLSDLLGEALAGELKLARDLALRDSFIEIASRVARDGEKSPGLESELAKVGKELGAVLKEMGTTGYETMVIISRDGTSFVDARGAGYAGLALKDRDYFKSAQGGKACIGKPTQSKSTGNPVVPVAIPIFSQSGEFVGAAAVILKIDYLVDKVAGTKIGTTGYAYMIDRDGIVLAHPKKELVFKVNAKEVRGTESITAKMLSGQKGVEAYEYQGKDRVAGFAPVALTGWSIAATQDKDEFLRPVYTIRNGIIIVGAVFLVLAVLGSVIFSRGISRPISRVVEGLNEAAEQVRAASKQVSSSSQELAEGTSEQAAAVEETSSSLEEMSSMTKQNADNAVQANQLMREAGKTVGQANQLMADLTVSMNEISSASEETQKIIKTIDEIAFQTNLLALNAAVEAARAGEAGAGFAVVADEVRNLAMRAAEAAKNTANLIEGTVRRVHSGSDVVGRTNSEFSNVATSVGKSGNLVGEIAAASQEQAQGIHQVNKAVAEMEQVIQRNAASAEESASAAEQMNAQAEQMKAFVNELAALIGGAQRMRNPEKTKKARPAPAPAPQRFVKAGKGSDGKGQIVRAGKEVPPEKLIPFDEDESTF